MHRPHLGKGMHGKPPLAKLQELGYDLPDRFGLLPPVILDRISVQWLVQTGNDVLAQYKFLKKNFSWHVDAGFSILYCIMWLT